MSVTARFSRHSCGVSLGVLALLAYLPALASSPGRMPADTKLFLYLDPGGLVGRAAATFEPDQFAGWVPFQQITYLWPSGPWYMLFDVLGVPDWIAHRLWIATIMFLAGAGVLWTARLLGVSRLGALAGALVYQLSPFLLAYVSRTSLLLLPWAGLGWIVALTIRATLATVPTDAAPWQRRLGPWRDAALIALIVATVGSANATTLAMIVPAPVLWIIHVAWQRRITWRRASAVTLRIAVMCTAVSIWWIAMLYVQSRNGAAVLAYTETLTDVSRNATGSEVLRGLGYWLFYQRDPIAPTTTASFDYLVSLRAMAISYGVILVGLVGLAVTSWAHRRFAAMCVAAGALLAVGVHPIDSPSPLMSLFVGDDGSGLALALRSSTRAVPVYLLGLALGAGALVSIIPRVAILKVGAAEHRAAWLRPAAAITVGLLAIVNLPSLWNRAFVDPAIDRDQDPPAAWSAGVDRLDDTDPLARVLQLPGAEFGAFRWGYTTDQPLVGLTDKPVVTRDLLPLGSPGAMDLLFALDDRIQEGTLEPSSLAPVARLLGSDVVWLSNDAAFERFRTARPEIVDDLLTTTSPSGLGTIERFGEPVINAPEVPMIDPAAIVEPSVGRAIAPVAVLPILDPVPIIRAKTETIVVSGSADGLVDAAAAGLISGHELVRYSASLSDDDLAAAVADARLVIITDTNRDQARHWRGSQDVRGHTEPGGPDDDVLDATTADQRLELFDATPDAQTVAVQDGPVTAMASSYGEPFAYRPEDRAVMAIDGDQTTAWLVGDHGEPIGERLRLTVGDDVDSEVTTIRLVQAAPAAGGRSIASIRVTVDGASPVDVILEPSSFGPTGQIVEIPTLTGGDAVDIEITGITPGQFPLAASVAGVGFSEIDLGLGPTTEFVRVPVDVDGALEPDHPAALVLTRWRTDAADPWRSDPEPSLRRRFDTIGDRTVDASVTLRLDPRANDEVLAALLPAGAPTATTRVAGGITRGGLAAVDGDPATAWVTGFDEAVGARLHFDTLGALGGELVLDQPTGPFSPITSIGLRRGNQQADVAVPQPDESGRSVVSLPPTFTASGEGPLELMITGVDARTTIDRRYGDHRTLPAAIAELTATVGIDPVPVQRSGIVAADCDPGFLVLDGDAVPISFETTLGSLLEGDTVTATACDPIALSATTHDLEAANAGVLNVDRVVLSDSVRAPTTAGSPTMPVEVTRNDPLARDAVVGACPQGCWVVLGEGFNTAWSATVAGASLGPAQLVDGGFNGWWLEPTDVPVGVEFRWTAQAPVTGGLIVSLLAAMICVVIVLATPRGRLEMLSGPTAPRSRRRPSRRRSIAAAAVLVGTCALLISPIWGAVALLPALVAGAAWPRGRQMSGWLAPSFEISGLAAAIAVAVGALWIERRDRPIPNAGWTEAFTNLNGLALFAVVAIAVGAMFATDAESDGA